jgi:rubrerythrin
MSDKPSYLGLLNAVALAEASGHCYFREWAAVTDNPDVRRVLLTVAAREGEHAMSFAKRITELGYELWEKPDESLPEKLEIVRSQGSDLEKMEALGLPDLDTGDKPDIFDDFFKNHSIDIRTGELLGRYIAEERDTARLLRGCYEHLCQAAASKPATNGATKKGAKGEKAARSADSRLAALEIKVDQLCRAIDQLQEIVRVRTTTVT